MLVVYVKSQNFLTWMFNFTFTINVEIVNFDSDA